MNRLIYIWIVVVLLGCSDVNGPDCDGYASEPFFRLVSQYTEPLGIFYLNEAGLGDTMFLSPFIEQQVPIDPSSDTMFYELTGPDTSYGQLVLVYETRSEYCDGTDELKLLLQNARFSSASDYPGMLTDSDGDQMPLDTTEDYSNFFNINSRAFRFIAKP